MGKLVIINGDVKSQEFILDQQRISLGRDQSNDVCLSDKSVSRHHANVVKIFTDFFLEDVKSTNGTRINGLEIKKRVLKDGDEIDIGKYKLRFQGESRADEGVDLDKTVVLNPRQTSTRKSAYAEQKSKIHSFAKPKKHARIRFLSGPDKDELQTIDRAFFSIGKPGGDLVLINRRHTGYFLLKMGGDVSPLVNGEAVRAGGVVLQDGDRVVLGELDFEFIL